MMSLGSAGCLIDASMTSPSTLGLSSCTMSATLDLPSQPAPPTHSSGPVFAIVTPRDRCRTLSDFFVISHFPSCFACYRENEGRPRHRRRRRRRGRRHRGAVPPHRALLRPEGLPVVRTNEHRFFPVFSWFFQAIFSVKIAGSASGFVRRKHGRGKGRKKERKRTAGETQRGCFAMRTCADLARCPRAFSPLFSRN